MVAGYLCSIFEVEKLFVKAFVKASVNSLLFLFLGSLSKTNQPQASAIEQSVCNITFMFFEQRKQKSYLCFF